MRYLYALLAVAGCTAINLLLSPWLSESDLVMVFLLGVVGVASRGPLSVTFVAAFGSVAAFDFFFIEPFYTFNTNEARYVLTFAVMGIVGAWVGLAMERSRSRSHAAAQAELALEAERVKSALLSSLSHDLRTPLGVIMGTSSTLLNTPHLDDAVRHEMTQNIHQESQRLARWVENLLEMTRLQRQGVRLRQDWHSTEELTGAALRMLTPSAHRRPIEVSIDPDAELIWVDGTLMELVLRNLLENALKYTPPGSPLELTARVQDQLWCLEVKDRGPGVSPSNLHKLFEPFWRDGAQQQKGSGLGLSIVQAAMEAHGGMARAQQRDGGGLVVVCCMPFREPPSLEQLEEEMG